MKNSGTKTFNMRYIIVYLPCLYICWVLIDNKHKFVQIWMQISKFLENTKVVQSVVKFCKIVKHSKY